MKHIFTLIILLSTLISSTQLSAVCNADVTITKPDSFYTDHNDGTVTDNTTGLMWQKCTLGQSGNDCATGTPPKFNWQAALAVANENTASNYTNWRLPNKNELATLTETACYSPPINETVFPQTQGTRTSFYWTSSPYAIINEEVWIVMFLNGSTVPLRKDYSAYIRLVRNIQ